MEISVAYILALGRCLASAMAIAPQPVPISAIKQDSGSFVFASSIAFSTRISVSGRGIIVFGVTIKFMPKNSLCPVM